MKTHLILTLVLATASALAQGPLTPPPGADPSIGPVNALTPGGLPQGTMKTLHQVEPPSLPPPALVSPAGSIENRTKLLTEQAGLTEDQQKKLQAILEKHDSAVQSAIAAWRVSHTKEDRKKASALLQAQTAKIAALLTEEQKAKAVKVQSTLPEWKSPPPVSTRTQHGVSALSGTPSTGPSRTLPAPSLPVPAK